MISPNRSLHHLEALTIEELEKSVLLMNNIMGRSIEVFQVTKIGSFWHAYFNVDSVAFADFKEGVMKAPLASNSPKPKEKRRRRSKPDGNVT